MACLSVNASLSTTKTLMEVIASPRLDLSPFPFSSNPTSSSSVLDNFCSSSFLSITSVFPLILSCCHPAPFLSSPGLSSPPRLPQMRWLILSFPLPAAPLTSWERQSTPVAPTRPVDNGCAVLTETMTKSNRQTQRTPRGLESSPGKEDKASITVEILEDTLIP